MSSDPRTDLALALRDYRVFTYGHAGWEGAARAFHTRVARLQGMGTPALEALEQALGSRDADERNAAARVLAGMSSPEAAQRLIAAFRQHARPQLDARSLARLGKVAPLPAALLPRLEEVRPFERSALARALFRRRSPEAEAALGPILEGFESTVAQAALAGIATWGEPALLRDLLARPAMRGPPSLPASLQPEDVRLDAAFHLALAGDESGLAHLRAAAGSRSPVQAARAALFLARLALPEAVAMTARLLRGKGQALEHALDAAGTLACAGLAPALLALAARPGVGEEALAELAWIVEVDEAAPPTPARLAARATALDPGGRYHRGRPLTLAMLAEALAALDAGPRIAAAWNLRAITGEDQCFDLDDDLAGNLAAIEAWRARARDPAPLAPGGWAFRGTPLPRPAAAS